MRIDLVSWDLEAGGMGVHQTRYGLVIDGVFYELPHRSALKCRDDVFAALELAGVDFDKGDPDALERQIKHVRRDIERSRVAALRLETERRHELAQKMRGKLMRLGERLGRLRGMRPKAMTAQTIIEPSEDVSGIRECIREARRPGPGFIKKLIGLTGGIDVESFEREHGRLEEE